LQEKKKRKKIKSIMRLGGLVGSAVTEALRSTSRAVDTWRDARDRVAAAARGFEGALEDAADCERYLAQRASGDSWDTTTGAVGAVDDEARTVAAHILARAIGHLDTMRAAARDATDAAAAILEARETLVTTLWDAGCNVSTVPAAAKGGADARGADPDPAILPQGMPRPQALVDWAVQTSTVASLRAGQWLDAALALKVGSGGNGGNSSSGRKGASAEVGDANSAVLRLVRSGATGRAAGQELEAMLSILQLTGNV
jgi:hypothetical protein